ncbi:uncharacterized protein LOC141680927 [Apium graveolens]|uniref:uncharacterized protein LOC141680927 n=1 Tax=Apium graveolens TaxID=4045 RepID=UPI003D7A92E9
MAEGTRIRDLDTRLSTHEGKLTELHDGLTKTRAEVTQQFTDMGLKMDKRLDVVGVRMDKLDTSFQEIKHLLMGMQSQHKERGPELQTMGEATLVKHQLEVLPYFQSNTHHVHLPPPLYPPPTQGLFTSSSMGYTTPLPTNSTVYSTVTNPLITPTPHQIVIPPPFNNYTNQTHIPPPFTGYTPPSPHGHNGFSNFHINPKIEFPKFDGSDPKGWVIRSEQYFEFIPVDDIRKMKLAGLHFEGKASIWFRYYQASKGVVNWKLFIADVIARFENPDGMDVQELFNKLKQTSTVADYEDRFEELRAMVLHKNRGFTEEYFVSSFLSGLKDHIKASVRMFRPHSLVDAVFLAKQEESKTSRPQLTFKTNATNSSTAIQAKHETRTLPSGYSSAFVKPVAKGITKSRSTLTSKEILERREKGQCFHCDDPYHPGQNCKAKLYSMFGEESEEIDCSEVEEVVGEMEQLLAQEESPGEISVNALSGNRSIGTIRLQGVLKGKRISILIDSGSTHSFIDSGLVKQLGLIAEVVLPLIVSVADGSRIIVDSICKKLEFTIQGHKFSNDLRLFPLGGSDLILGVDWLKQFNPITLDYAELRITLVKEGVPITLQGDTTTGSLHTISGKQLSKLLKNSKGATQGYICMLTAEPQISDQPSSCQVPHQIQELLNSYNAVFAEPEGLPPVRQQDHQIPLLEGTQPINQRCYRVPYIQKAEIERQVKEMLNSGVIQESSSPFASPVILVKKKNGTWRMCIDYRRLNEATVKNRYPIPIIDKLLDELQGACWFTKLDLRSGYHQIRVAPQDIYKIAFRTHQGLYEFKVMPFGLTNAPASFQSLMNSVFQQQLRKSVLVFFDDILKSKCLFGQQKLEYLGHIISKEGVSTYPSKVDVMVNWPIPKSLKQLRGFLGLTGYYRRFIKGYGEMSRPLTNLLKKGSFNWTNEATVAFQTLKNSMVSAPVLALPDYTLPFTIETDASGTGIGAKWYTYLQGHHFIIKTDHQSLKYILEQRLSTLLQQKWLAKLMGLDYEISYKKGADNKVADALSRLPDEASEGKLTTITTLQPNWLNDLLQSYEKDVEARTVMEGVVANKPAYAQFQYCKGLIKVGDRIYVGNTGDTK